MLSSIPSEIIQHLQENGYQSTGFSFSGGGCINQGGKLKTNTGYFFLKWNDAKAYPDMFKAEADGLALLRKQDVIDIPSVITTGHAGKYQFLLLQYVESKVRSKNYWHTLGQQLAALHKVTSDEFGLDHDNYIGSLRQYNSRKEKWIDFFITQRLEVQLKLAVTNGMISTEMVRQFDVIYQKLSQLLPEEKPSLLHGDLWSGNLMVNHLGEPCLIDPAVFYGHREAELAFTQLFGGFDAEFYNSYEEHFPLTPGFSKRADIYNLYPLLVHVNLFGGSYVAQVRSILKQFS